MTTQTYFLTGDIGGTNSRMSFYDATGRNPQEQEQEPLVQRIYRNAHCIPSSPNKTSFQEHIIEPFLKQCKDELKLGSMVVIACLACAGPVMNNQVQMSNLNNCLIDGNALSQNIPEISKCVLINDFVAAGYGCLTLQIQELKHLHGPKFTTTQQLRDTYGPMVCVGAGTGLGECYLTPETLENNNKSYYTCFPSEGGHIEFSPRSDTEREMQKYLQQKFDAPKKQRISVERVVSGIGLSNVYEFLSKHFPTKVNNDIHTEFLNGGDMAAAVVAKNTEKNELCKQAMDIMMSAYGGEVGNAALKFIPTGGLFVAGGLTPKNIHHIEPKNSPFLQAYKNKGRVSGILELVPTYAVMVEDIGVRGALQCAKMTYERMSQQSSGATNTSPKDTVPKSKMLLSLAMTGAVAFAAGLFFSKKR